MCIGALGVLELPFGNDVWLLGDTFTLAVLDLILKCFGTSLMRNVYTVFDVDKEAVGFAQLH